MTTPKNGKATMYTSGWPKNQNRCCHKMGEPPLTGSKKFVPNCRSASSIISAPDSTGNASRTMKAVMNRFQVSIGMRNRVIPGVRIIVTVVITFTAVNVPDVPVRMIEMIHRSAPSPGEPDIPDSGGYANHPNAAAPPSLANPRIITAPPMAYSQYENAFSRGKARSGAPICSGTR